MRWNRGLRLSPTSVGRLRTPRLLGALAVVAISAGCGFSSSIDRAAPRIVLWESGFDYVRIEAQDGIDRGFPPNDHPARFTAEQIRDLLATMRIQPVPGSRSRAAASHGAPRPAGCWLILQQSARPLTHQRFDVARAPVTRRGGAPSPAGGGVWIRLAAGY